MLLLIFAFFTYKFQRISFKLNPILREWTQHHPSQNILNISPKVPTSPSTSDLATKEQLVSNAESDTTFSKMVVVYWKDLYSSDVEFITNLIAYYKYNEGKLDII